MARQIRVEISGRLRSLPFGMTRLSAARALEQAEFVDNGDGTSDVRAVEILSVGGPIHGIGSPPEGDFWSLDELRSMVTADTELGDELLPPNKIGHPDDQILVENSIDAGDLPTPTDGEMPAVGWLEDLRMDGEKLLADVKRVPNVVADLIQKGAYRTRSVELSKVTSQKTGKTYDWVVTGLAWLGGKMPAVKTLGDVAALYAGDVPVRRLFVDYAAGDVVWSHTKSLQTLRYALQEALNGPDAETVDPRWYVVDVSMDGQAIVEDWAAVSPGQINSYMVSFEVTADGVTVAPVDQWTKVESTYVEAARQNEERLLTIRERRADTRPMKFSEAKRRAFAEATGLEFEKVTDKMLEDAGVAPETDPPTDPPADPPESQTTTTNTGEQPAADEETDADRNLQARVVALETQLHQENRRSFVEQAIKDCKVAPGQRKELEDLYDKTADGAKAFVDALPRRDDLEREFGSDDDDPDERELEENERSYQAGAVDRLGISKEQLV